jgi:predicted ATPase
VDIWLGRADRAIERCGEGLRIAREQEYAYVAALGTMIRGWAEGEKGDPRAGAGQIERGLVGFRSTGAEIVVPFFLTLQAELLVRAGGWEESLPLLDDAIARIRRWGESWQEPEVHRVRGLALCAGNGDKLSPEAEAAFVVALETAVNRGADAWRIRACSDYARQLSRAGRREEAEQILDPVLTGRRSGAEYPDVGRAEDLLRDLRSFAAPGADHSTRD